MTALQDGGTVSGRASGHVIGGPKHSNTHECQAVIRSGLGMGAPPRRKGFTALMAIILVILPTSGCVLITPDDTSNYIGPPILIATEWNGTVHWEARWVFYMFREYGEGLPWENIEVELVGEGRRPFEFTTDVLPDTGELTDEPEVFYIDRVGQDDILNRNDVPGSRVSTRTCCRSA